MIANILIFLFILKTGGIVSQVFSTQVTIIIVMLSMVLFQKISIKEFLKLIGLITLVYSIFVINHALSDYTYKTYIIYFYTSIVAVYFLNKKILLINSLEKILYFILLHSFINYFIVLFHLYILQLPFESVYEIKEQVMTLFYIFNYYQPFESYGGIFGLPRNIGLFWEPGLLQIYLNLYLFILFFIKNEDLNKKSILAIVALFITQSTTGLIIMSMIIFVKYFKLTKKSIEYFIIFSIIFILAVYPYIANKLFGDLIGSGLVRVSDMYISYKIFVDNFLFGYGFEYFNQDKYFELYKFYMYDIVSYLNIPIFVIDEIIKSKSGSTHDYLKIGAVYGVLIFSAFNYGWYKFGKLFSDKAWLFLIIIVLFVSLEPIGTAPFMVFLMMYGLTSLSKKLIYRGRQV